MATVAPGPGVGGQSSTGEEGCVALCTAPLSASQIIGVVLGREVGRG